MRKFAGLLPEIYRRHLYKRRGFGSIHQFAAQLAGMSEASVDRVLRLSERLKEKPKLLHQLESGEQAWSKVEKASYVATKETDGFWAEKVSHLSQPSLEVYVTEYQKTASKSVLQNEPKMKKEIEQEPWPKFFCNISPEVEKEMKRIKYELGEAETWNDVLKFLLNQKEKTSQKPIRVIQLCPDCITQKAQQDCEETCERYMPADVKNLVLAKHGEQCVFPQCQNHYDDLHHTKRFSLQHNHDPNFIVPLCKKHHHFLHTGLVENEEKDPAAWTIREEPNIMSQKYVIDSKFQTHLIHH